MHAHTHTHTRSPYEESSQERWFSTLSVPSAIYFHSSCDVTKTAESPVLMTTLITKWQILVSPRISPPCSHCLQLRVPWSFSTSSTLPFSAIKISPVSGPLMNASECRRRPYYICRRHHTVSSLILHWCHGKKLNKVVSMRFNYLK